MFKKLQDNNEEHLQVMCQRLGIPKKYKTKTDLLIRMNVLLITRTFPVVKASASSKIGVKTGVTSIPPTKMAEFDSNIPPEMIIEESTNSK